MVVCKETTHPELAPDLNQRSLAHFKLHKHQRCQIALRVVIRKVLVCVSIIRVVRRAENVVCVARVLHK